MAGVYRRKSDRARGKAGKWTAWFIDESGKRRSRVAFPDRQKSLDLAHDLEYEARRVREGLVDPAARAWQAAAARPLADHVADYRLSLLAKGDIQAHADRTASVLGRLLADAGVASVADLAPDRIQGALGRLRARFAPRTCNFYLRAVQAFAKWLALANRIKEVPRGLVALTPYNEQVDRRRVRRALSREELARLLAAAEAGPTIRLSRKERALVEITGPERAMLYRLAMGTGFRAAELRSLTPESFHLAGDAPMVTVAAAYSKRRRDDIQPIRHELAAVLQPWLVDKSPGKPVLVVPPKCAKLLRRDLAAAGIPERTAAGVVDFHSLRHTYITHLIASGADPKTVQVLARHSTITLTIDRYAKTDDARKRQALEGEGS